jgi:hypothetical protein
MGQFRWAHMNIGKPHLYRTQVWLPLLRRHSHLYALLYVETFRKNPSVVGVFMILLVLKA